MPFVHQTVQIIRSRHRHDYVTHTDANGKEYMVDGGVRLYSS